MLDFYVDSSDLASEFTLTQDQVDDLVIYCVEEVTTEVARHWSDEVKQGLGSTRQQYLNALSIEKVDMTTRAVFLDPGAWLPNAIEQGKGAYDMKQGFLSSDKVKYTKEGNPYLTIAFRFSTPDALGESEAFSGIMPRAIHSAVQANYKQGGSKAELGIGDIPRQFQIPESPKLRQTLKSIGYDKLESDTKMTSIYAGLRKQEGGSGYVNFRRVSLASDKDSWQHPGFDAKNFAGKAEEKVAPIIPNIVDSAIDNFLSNLGF